MSLQIVIHDVGHGQCIQASLPDNQLIQIDLGCASGFSPLAWLRQRRDTIDYLIITHPHGDHIDEICLIKELKFNIRQLWRPKWLSPDDIYKANQLAYEGKVARYLELSNFYTGIIAPHECVASPIVNGGVNVQVFASHDCGTSNINNHSGVVIFEYLGVKVIIPGDNEPASWRALINDSNFLHAAYGANIFMASHHGRESGYCKDLFDAIGSPDLCVISDGRVQDTDATHRYSYHARGGKVIYRSTGLVEKRYCLTTRSDGDILIEIDKDMSGLPVWRASCQ